MSMLPVHSWLPVLTSLVPVILRIKNKILLKSKSVIKNTCRENNNYHLLVKLVPQRQVENLIAVFP